MSRIAVYPGTFDPITRGHQDIVKRSLRIFDRIIVAIGPNPKKAPLFTLPERVSMLQEVFKNLPGVSIRSFDGLLVDFVRIEGAHAIIRGLRAISDFESEFQMALMNRKLDEEIETVYLMPSEEYSYLTSSLIKEIAQFGGDISPLVSPIVKEMLEKKFRRS
ncbi:MAG: pantetheine-phosphate adenylyltransferase [Nitrospirae bacterium]|nr:pantetheine-phosphate adenylyltransferase [Nitrospirota bacterium]